MANITMRQMLEAGVHFGHQSRYWNPKMAPYIYGLKNGVHIINLEQTLPLYQEALNLVAEVAARRGKILFVGTKYTAREIIREEASRCGMPYVHYRWLGGMLTNYKTIRQSIRRLKDLETRFAKGETQGFTKKETLNLMREQEKLEYVLSGIKDMGSLPDLLFVIDVGHESIAVREANRLSIPVIGIVDTNNSPEGVNYVVPGNDDALRSIRLYTKTLADVIIEARLAAGISSVEAEGEDLEKEVAVKRRIVSRQADILKQSAAAIHVGVDFVDEDFTEDEGVEDAALQKPGADKVSPKAPITALDKKPKAPVRKVIRKVIATDKEADKATIAKKPVTKAKVKATEGEKL